MAAVVIETSNVAQGNAGGTTSHTLTTSANRAVIVMIDDESESQASGVTYNSVAMSLVASSTSTPGLGNASSMWMILEANLPTGGASYNVSVTGLDAGASVTVVELNNVVQVVPSSGAVDTTETGAVTTTTATVTAPSGDSLALGCAGHGSGGTVFSNPPTGTGTWTRFFQIVEPPSGARLGSGYQAFTTSGSKNYTETVASAWNRSSQILAVFAAIVEPVGELTVDGTGSGASSGTTLSWSHTFAAGSNKKLVVVVGAENDSSTVTSITYDGVDLTEIGEHEVGTSFQHSGAIWYLDETDFPSTPGSYTVTVTFSVSVGGSEGGSISFHGAKQGTQQFVFTDDGSAGDQSISDQITTDDDGAIVVEYVASGNAITGFSPTAGQTEWFDLEGSGASDRGAGGYEQFATAGQQTQSWDCDSTSNRLVYVLTAVEPAQVVADLHNAAIMAAHF